MKIDSEKILKDFTSFIIGLGKINEPHLGSFCFSIDKIESVKYIDELSTNYDDLFHFRTPENRITVTGLNSALEFKSETNRFFSANDQFIYWENNLIKNWDETNFGWPKIICCAAKFDTVKSLGLWDDFDSLRIYIPEFIFSFEDDKSSAFFNFIINDDKEIGFISDKFLQYIKFIENLNEKSAQDLNTKINSTLTSCKEDVTEWQKTFNESMNYLTSEEVAKLVLSRVYSFNIANSFDWTSLLTKLSDRFNDCYTFFTKWN
ncbi:MAG: hypothetical protein P8X47_08575, partial [Ignavibacteriaceae bacterium]